MGFLREKKYQMGNEVQMELLPSVPSQPDMSLPLSPGKLKITAVL
jgi:hypothetical protein